MSKQPTERRKDWEDNEKTIAYHLLFFVLIASTEKEISIGQDSVANVHLEGMYAKSTPRHCCSI